VLCARDHVGREPFAVLLGDTIMDGRRKPVTRQLMEVFERYQESVVAVEEVERAKVSRYGVIKGTPVMERLYLLNDLVEKPSVQDAPSNLAIASRYILTPDIFDLLEKTERGKNNEIQLTDAMRRLVKTRAMYALQFEGARYDVGNKLDFIKTNLIFGLKHKDMAKELRACIRLACRCEACVPRSQGRARPARKAARLCSRTAG
jgi:UTP--glucose-1-phosphate uridylyltransferase